MEGVVGSPNTERAAVKQVSHVGESPVVVLLVGSLHVYCRAAGRNKLTARDTSAGNSHRSPRRDTPTVLDIDGKRWDYQTASGKIEGGEGPCVHQSLLVLGKARGLRSAKNTAGFLHALLYGNATSCR